MPTFQQETDLDGYAFQRRAVLKRHDQCHGWPLCAEPHHQTELMLPLLAGHRPLHRIGVPARTRCLVGCLRTSHAPPPPSANDVFVDKHEWDRQEDRFV